MPDDVESSDKHKAPASLGKLDEKCAADKSISIHDLLNPVSPVATATNKLQEAKASLPEQMDRPRREKSLALRSSDVRVPPTSTFRADLDGKLAGQKERSLTANDGAAKAVTVNSTAFHSVGKSESEQKKVDDSPKTFPNASESATSNTINSSRASHDTSKKISSKRHETEKGAANTEQPRKNTSHPLENGTSNVQDIDFDDATIAHRMWMYLHNKQIDLDDGRRAWVNAFNGVKKQAEELERKKQALEKYRDGLVALEEQLPAMEKKLQEDADALYKRRKTYDDKFNELKKKREELHATKIELVEWSRKDDREYDMVLRLKPPRRKHTHHHVHPHGGPHIPHVPNNHWDSPISTPDSQLDDYSFADPGVIIPYGPAVGYGAMELEDAWGMSLPKPLPIGAGLAATPGAGPSSSAMLAPLTGSAVPPGTFGALQKKKSKGKGAMGPPPPPPPGDNALGNMVNTDKKLQDMMNVSENASSTSTTSESPTPGMPPPVDGPPVGLLDFPTPYDLVMIPYYHAYNDDEEI
jgi:hypothetical protein